MFTSVLYRALGIRGYKHQAIREQDGRIVLTVRHDGSELVCPHYGSANVWRRGTVPRSWQAPPIGHRPVTVEPLACPTASNSTLGETQSVYTPMRLNDESNRTVRQSLTGEKTPPTESDFNLRKFPTAIDDSCRTTGQREVNPALAGDDCRITPPSRYTIQITDGVSIGPGRMDQD